MHSLLCEITSDRCLSAPGGLPLSPSDCLLDRSVIGFLSISTKYTGLDVWWRRGGDSGYKCDTLFKGSLTLIKIKMKCKSIFSVSFFILEVITGLMYSRTVIWGNETPSEWCNMHRDPARLIKRRWQIYHPRILCCGLWV